MNHFAIFRRKTRVVVLLPSGFLFVQNSTLSIEVKRKNLWNALSRAAIKIQVIVCIASSENKNKHIQMNKIKSGTMYFQ